MKMAYEGIDTELIDCDSIPWLPYTPFTDQAHIKLIKADPIRGETITFLRAPAGLALPKHHHTGTVIVYTVKGAWRYLEHDWVATPGSVVFETASSSHTAQAVEGHGDEIITLNITVGELIYLDENDQPLAIESWKTMVDRYLAYCAAEGITPQDVTSFQG